jgi:Protein of unknown function (DUF3099)
MSCRKDLAVPSSDRPVLITDAPASLAQQRADRSRRYTFLMGGRLVLFVLAALVYPLSVWLAVALLALSIPLPWMAVLIANDAPPRKAEKTARWRPDQVIETRPVPALERPVVIDVPSVPADRAA